MYNQSYQPSFGQQQVQSQYRGLQRQFQPTGYVQSFYQQQAPTQFGVQGAQNYHTASYVGNQPNHDRYLHEDSFRPAQTQQFGIGRSQGIGVQSSFAPTQTSSFIGSTGFQSSAQFGGLQGTQNYHTASYVGNQPNHDRYLHEDSAQPAQMQQFGMGRAQSSSFGMGMGTSLPNSQYATPYRNV